MALVFLAHQVAFLEMLQQLQNGKQPEQLAIREQQQARSHSTVLQTHLVF